MSDGDGKKIGSGAANVSSLFGIRNEVVEMTCDQWR